LIAGCGRPRHVMSSRSWMVPRSSSGEGQGVPVPYRLRPCSAGSRLGLRLWVRRRLRDLSLGRCQARQSMLGGCGGGDIT
jgi:hypothetical protein